LAKLDAGESVRAAKQQQPLRLWPALEDERPE